MPHIRIEASGNVAELVPPKNIVSAIHEAACTIPMFPLAGMRTRLNLYQHYRVSDGKPDRAFIHIEIHITRGFDAESRRAASERLMATLVDLFASFEASTPLLFSVEVTEIDPETRVNRSNMRDFMRVGSS